MKTTTLAPARSAAEQRARIRFTAARAAIALKQAHDPLPADVRDELDYYRNLTGKD